MLRSHDIAELLPAPPGLRLIDEAHQISLDDLLSIPGDTDGGAQRTVRIDREAGVVYKVARPGGTSWGGMASCVRAQFDELRAYQLGYEGIPVAPCRMLWHETGAPIIVMELLTRVQHEMRDNERDLPWFVHSVDCMQIGWSALLDGWAVYDAGVAPHGGHARQREIHEGIAAA
jgi:hypothetical protein